MLAELNLDQHAAVIVSGDTCARSKPYPDSILHACNVLDIAPEDTWYVGDADRDIVAGREAGCTTVGAAYGYIHPNEQIVDWQADYIIRHPIALLNLLSKSLISK